MSHAIHLDEDVLDRYYLRQLSEQEVASLEEHLLVCASCQCLLEDTDDFVRALRRAESVAEEWQRNGGGIRNRLSVVPTASV